MLRQSKWPGKTIGPKKGGGTHAEAEQVVSKDHRVSRTQEGRRNTCQGRASGLKGP